MDSYTGDKAENQRRTLCAGGSLSTVEGSAVENNKTAPDPTSLLWDVNALAENTGIPLRTARSIIAQRRVPVVKVGRLARVRPADVFAYLDANTIPAAR